MEGSLFQNVRVIYSEYVSKAANVDALFRAEYFAIALSRSRSASIE